MNTTKPVRKIPTIWYTNETINDKEAKERHLSSLLSNKIVADRLHDILYDYMENLETFVKDYDTPSWSHKQAHLNGMKEAYWNIYELILPLSSKHVA